METGARQGSAEKRKNKLESILFWGIIWARSSGSTPTSGAALDLSFGCWEFGACKGLGFRIGGVRS